MYVKALEKENNSLENKKPAKEIDLNIVNIMLKFFVEFVHSQSQTHQIKPNNIVILKSVSVEEKYDSYQKTRSIQRTKTPPCP